MDIQLDIENAIRYFTKTDDYKTAGKELFRSIVGAELIHLDNDYTPEEFIKVYKREDMRVSAQQRTQEIFNQNIERIHFTNQLTEETIKELKNIEGSFNNSHNYIYSYLFVIVLMKPNSYLKDIYKKITKRMNRYFNTPTFVLFYRQKDNNHFISLSFIGRRPHKSKDEYDVVNRKVPILFNIDCAYPHQEYVERISDLHIPTCLKSLPKEQRNLELLMKVWLKILNLNISSDYSIRREIRRKRGQKLLALYYSQNKEGTL